MSKYKLHNDTKILALVAHNFHKGTIKKHLHLYNNHMLPHNIGVQ